MVKLVVDARERAIVPHITIPHEVSQMPIGDYIIEADDGTPLACFERKTLSDFGSSIRDRRKYENFDKMFGLRGSAPHLQLYLILEGDFTPDPEEKFGGIKYSSILSSATNLMVERDVFMIQTSGKQHTAQRLEQLVASFEKRRPTARGAEDVDNKTVENINAKYVGSGSGTALRFVRSEIEEATLCLSAVPGLSLETARVVLEHHSIAELIKAPEKLATVPRPSGRKIGKVASEAFARSRSSVDESSKILSKITGISGKMIKKSLIEIVQLDTIDDMGKHRSDKIIKILNTKLKPDISKENNGNSGEKGTNDRGKTTSTTTAASEESG